ncbi:MAG TPA: hypothetical protein VFD92_00605 [Candidatus Binatia bacterium]|nr:hypothetical protein [Candidatus Binatia bacterium]
MTRSVPKRFPALALALVLASPAMSLAAGSSFVARLELEPGNGALSSIKSATLKAKTTNKRGANGVLVTLKVSGALDATGLPANVTVTGVVGFDGLYTHCEASRWFSVPIVNGSANVTLTGTDLGNREQNTPDRMLYLCQSPRLFVNGNPSRPVALVHLYSDKPGTIVQGAFARNTSSSNPITSWKTAKVGVQSVNGRSLVSIGISGAMEGAVPSSRVLIPVIPTDGSTCDSTPFFIYGVSLDGGRGQTLIPGIDNGDPDPGRCLAVMHLEDSSLNVIAYGPGIVQGTDAD